MVGLFYTKVIMSVACVTLCDEAYFPKAKQTIYELRNLGKWNGDVILMAIDFDPPPIDNVIIYRTTHIPTDDLIEFYKKHPFTKGDGRHLRLLVQWDKLQVFKPFFHSWKRILMIDAGMRILNDITPILQLEGAFLAPDDGEYPTNPHVRFHTMIDETACPETYQALLTNFGNEILYRRQFVNCLFVFDTSLIAYEELIDAMRKYPIGTCNEMMTMNLIINCKYNLWKPFPRKVGDKYVFGWNESHQNGTPGTWRDFIFMKYPFHTPKTIISVPNTAFVTLSDITYYPKAKRTIQELQENGLWGGDIVFIAVDFDPEDNIPGVEIYKTTHIDTTELFEHWKKHPLPSLPDNRHYGKVYQWDKLQVFKEYFKKWDRIVFMDAGLRIFNTVQPLLDLEWKHKLLAPDDSDPYDNGNRFGSQIDLNANMPVTISLFSEYPITICGKHYFNNPIFVFDTSLPITFEELQSTMNRFPIFMCNETGLMNLIFNYKYDVWTPFPQITADGKYLFGWAENNYREGPNWDKFHFIKYSLTRP